MLNIAISKGYVYPCFNKTRPWYTAAADLICSEANCSFDTEIKYSLDIKINPYFILYKN